MLGGNRELPDINERKPFQRIAMAMRVDDREFHLERAVVGGDFSMRGEGVESRILSARHKKDSDFNLSNVLLGQLGLAGMEIAKDKSGTKKPLSFRDVVRLCIVDETSIQSEPRSEAHTSELQSLMRIPYAVLCLNKKKIKQSTTYTNIK